MKTMLNKLFKQKNIKNSLDNLGPLYHSYRLFGVENQQLPGVFQPNQACKEPIILSYILLALAKCKTSSDMPVTFAELFCADGYYAMAARHLGASTAVGIDNNREGHFTVAKKIAKRLEIDNCTFIEMDVNDIEAMAPIDIVANIGGLYHVENPEEILDKSYSLARRFLIVQTVVSLASEAEDYYESPAPNWTWGNRYSHLSFKNLIENKGWNIIDSHFNILEGNDKPEDRGSIYFLIQKDS